MNWSGPAEVWRDELAQNRKRAFRGNGNRYKYVVIGDDLERSPGWVHAEK